MVWSWFELALIYSFLQRSKGNGKLNVFAEMYVIFEML